MGDEYLQENTNRPEIADIHYTYSPQQEETRNQLIKLIEDEKRDYLKRVEPYLQQLAKIQGTPHIIIRTGLR